jgi:hypothetical protein
MGNESPPTNPIEASVKEIQQKKQLDEQIKEADKAIKDMQGPLENYRPGMNIGDNQAAFFTLPNYLGNVTILNIGAKDVQVHNVNSIKYGKNVSINLKNVTGQDSIVNAFQGPPLQIPNLPGGNKMWTINVTATPVPKIVPPSSTYEECIYAVENTGFIPKVTWGSTPANKQDGSCDQKLCDYWPKKYPNGVPPQFVPSIAHCPKPAVNNSDINKIVARNIVAKGSDIDVDSILANAKAGKSNNVTLVSAAAQSQVVKSANVIAPVQLDNASTVQVTTVKSNDNREWECRPVGSKFPDNKSEKCQPVNVTCSPCENDTRKKSKKTKKSKKVKKQPVVKVSQKDVINQMKSGNNQSTKSEYFTETFIDLQDDYCYVNLVVGLLIIAIVLHMKGVFQ